ncbi:MAG: hypothetical protein K9J37_15075 [Saprospiraceae bacterium]|nr:hypothetical protein [Saprospiraceae bacterium]MCF8251232.1 hypothetical protein [Saprospiraceae bacterium]MCF8281216.1 hypothetical protein [Bacteroidales bacterium]MCF8313144.1 hypothetical protein [Saprospiraceae bacterium]MCF8441594.1 hypothetical protein [Saprospiraceae bacterium]
MNDEYNFEQIERYLLGRMPEDERASFEESLSQNSQLAEDLQQFRTILGGLELHDYQQLKSKINIARAEVKGQDATNALGAKTVVMKPKNAFRWLWAAAAVLVLAVGVYWAVQQDDATYIGVQDLTVLKPDAARIDRTIEELRASGFAAGEEGKRDSLVTGWEYYKKFEFEKAKQIAAPLRETYPNDPMPRHLLGLSIFQLTEYAKAFELLDPLTLADDFEKQDEAQFYVAYCYNEFKTKQGHEAACGLFQKVAENGNSTYMVAAKQQLVANKCN